MSIYFWDVFLVGDSRLILSALLPLLNQKDNLEYLKSKQKAMKNWNRLLEEKSTRTDKPIKPQVIAKAVSDELEDHAIISVDCGTNTSWAARYIDIREGMKFLCQVHYQVWLMACRMQ
jgi:pyruvate dehydrogenase (quinone)